MLAQYSTLQTYVIKDADRTLPAAYRKKKYKCNKYCFKCSAYSNGSIRYRYREVSAPSPKNEMPLCTSSKLYKNTLPVVLKLQTL